MIVELTAELTRDSTGLADKRPWYVYAASYTGGSDGVVTTKRSKPIYPVGSTLTIRAEAGIVAYIENPEGKKYLVDIPEADGDLWPVIEAGEAYPPDTPQSLLNTAVVNALPPLVADELDAQVGPAVSDDLAARQFTFNDVGDGNAQAAVGGTPIGDPVPWPAATWSGIVDHPELPLDAAVEGGIDKTGATNIRDDLETLVQSVNGARPIHFPLGRYRLGTTGASSGFNRINLPSGTSITCDPGTVFEINQLDYQANTAVFVAQGTDGAKQDLDSDITYSLYGNQTVTLPAGVAATFSPGDLIGFESRAVSVAFQGVNTLTSEIAKVEYVDGDDVTLDHPLHFAYLMSDSAQFWKITPVENVHLSGMTFEPGPGVTPGVVGQSTNAIRFGKTLNCSIRDVQIRNMIGGIDLHDAYDTRVDHLTVDRLLRQDSSVGSVNGGYGLLARARTTNLLVNSMVGRECRHVFTTLPDLRGFSGTAQAGAASTVTLAAGSSSVDGYYVNGDIVITSGTGSGQTKHISAYNGTTKVATIDGTWSVTPDATSVYTIYQGWGGPMYVKINDSIGFGGSNGGTSIWDTHEQGRFIEFNNCTAVGGDPDRNPSGTGGTQAGFQIRAKHVKINNPKVFHVPRYGITFTDGADYGLVNGGEVAYGGDVGVVIQAPNVTVIGVDIHHNDGQGINVSTANVTITDTYIANCRIFENDNYAIQDGSASVRTVIQSCFLPKGTIQTGGVNALSTTLLVKDCICPGYGTGGNNVGIYNLASGAKYTGCYGDNGVFGNATLSGQALSTPTLTDARIPSAGAIRDANGNTLIEVPTTVASAVNWLRVNNTAAGGYPGIEVRGSDTNPYLTLALKGAGGVFLYTPSGTNITYLAGGAGANIGHNFVVKGTGTMQVGGNPMGVKVAVPASAAATGVPGQWAADSSYIYVCTAANTWMRAAIATW